MRNSNCKTSTVPSVLIRLLDVLGHFSKPPAGIFWRIFMTFLLNYNVLFSSAFLRKGRFVRVWKLDLYTSLFREAGCGLCMGGLFVRSFLCTAQRLQTAKYTTWHHAAGNAIVQTAGEHNRGKDRSRSRAGVREFKNPNHDTLQVINLSCRVPCVLKLILVIL